MLWPSTVRGNIDRPFVMRLLLFFAEVSDFTLACMLFRIEYLPLFAM